MARPRTDAAVPAGGGTPDWAAYVDSMAAVHGLTLEGARRIEVIRQLERIDALARRFVDFPLEPEVEPAPVLRP